MQYYDTGQPYDNGTNPQIDSILQDIATEYHTPVPKYKVGMPMDKPNVLGTYDTDTKVIEFRDVNPHPRVVVHEGFHSVHDNTPGMSCDVASCENYAYMQEVAFGKSRGLYRLKHEYNPSEHKTYFREYAATTSPSGAQTFGALLLVGAAAGAGYEFIIKKKKLRLNMEAGLIAGVGVIGAYLLTR